MVEPETPIEPPVNLDEIERRYPPDIKPEEWKRMVAAGREARAGWLEKQEAKGKEE